MGNPLDPRPYPSSGCRHRWRENAQIFPLFSGAMCKQGRNYGEGHRSQAISESVVAVIIGGKTPRFSRFFRSCSHDKRVKKNFFFTYWKHPRHAGYIVRLCLVSVLVSRRSVTPRDLSNTGSPVGFPKTRANKPRGMLRIKSAMLSLCLCECGPHSPIATVSFSVKF